MMGNSGPSVTITTSTMVAVKAMQIDCKSEKHRASWLHKMETIIKLRHDHLVAIHNVRVKDCPDGGLHVEVLMDYYPNGNLSTFLKQLKAQQEFLLYGEIIRYAVDITSGLVFLHQKNIIHGDLKPGNILVKHLGAREIRLLRLVICDCDNPIQMQQNTTVSSDISVTHLLGTLRYMSPEMLKKFVKFLGERTTFPPPGRKTDILYGALAVLC
ncbi:proto-oncogene serine/threonine-protein kinase mos-like [Paramacrobiotus metropolitanus]|uniref:proto-oncogene serine/threonine-protein kinase mos-like n=1 Tax=Paramacrobiotus metropolitanus TaxID=2943436 RepID=UPI0024465AEC|nr:proto-oncogene serine/threonine-protein kinase mos-like [Paramacrobiotus metropolitanus]